MLHYVAILIAARDVDTGVIMIEGSVLMASQDNRLVIGEGAL
jgi:hypothetical protein